VADSRRVGIRWTIGDVSPAGFEALRLSVWGAWKLFGPHAAYAVCVNSVPLEEARRRAGELPPRVIWWRSTGRQLPEFIAARMAPGMAEGAGWKLSPLRLFPDRWELSLDNDCILWEMPAAVRAWLEAGDRHATLMAEDVRTCFGRFAAQCGSEPRNAGIRGMPPGFDFAAALRAVLEEEPGPIESELDEQGLQTAALARAGTMHVVTLDDVSICSPFPPHLPLPGRCGAHFVGLNARRLPWSHEGLPATHHIRAHWLRLRGLVYERVGIRRAEAA
jgi:hypothetical protein